MNDFAKLLAGQLGADFRTLPQRVRTRLSAEGQAARAGTIGELREAARHRGPAVVFDYVDGAAGDEVTAARNLAELRAVELRPRVMVDVSKVETATSVLGSPIALPLLGAPMGLTGLMHPSHKAAAGQPACRRPPVDCSVLGGRARPARWRR